VYVQAARLSLERHPGTPFTSRGQRSPNGCCMQRAQVSVRWNIRFCPIRRAVRGARSLSPEFRHIVRLMLHCEHNPAQAPLRGYCLSVNM
jgi:hypothetical protein